MIDADAQRSISFESEEAKKILDLDNDSFAKIFSFLSSTDVLNAECVNKRFRNVSKMYWQQKVHFDWKIEINSISDKRQRAKATVTICSRIRDRLKSINLSIFNIDFEGDEFVSIGYLCPNISSITFDDRSSPYKHCPADILFNSFVSLKELYFRPRGIQNCIILSSLQLHSIPKSIEILTGVNGVRDYRKNFFERIEEFCNFFINYSALVEIDASNMNSADNKVANIFPIIASFCPRLKKIILKDCSFALNGIELLEGMKVLKLWSTNLTLKISDEQMIAICNRNSELQVMDFGPHSSLTICAFESIVGLRKLRDLNALGWNGDEMSFEEKQQIIQKLFTNSGASLQHLWLPRWKLTSRTIEIMADLCPLLRYVSNICVLPGSVSPELIRHLIDRIVKRPEWKNGKDKLELYIYVFCGFSAEGNAAFASFEALKAKDSMLPDRVKLLVWRS